MIKLKKNIRPFQKKYYNENKCKRLHGVFKAFSEEMVMATILVTGGAGYIGSQVMSLLFLITLVTQNRLF